MEQSQLFTNMIKNFLSGANVDTRLPFDDGCYGSSLDNRVEVKNRKTGAVGHLSLDSSEIAAYFKNI